jgi:hypothetical protein
MIRHLYTFVDEELNFNAVTVRESAFRNEVDFADSGRLRSYVGQRVKRDVMNKIERFRY